jgi:hypothetical protein
MAILAQQNNVVFSFVTEPGIGLMMDVERNVTCSGTHKATSTLRDYPFSKGFPLFSLKVREIVYSWLHSSLLRVGACSLPLGLFKTFSLAIPFRLRPHYPHGFPVKVVLCGKGRNNMQRFADDLWSFRELLAKGERAYYPATGRLKISDYRLLQKKQDNQKSSKYILTKIVGFVKRGGLFALSPHILL